MDGPWGTGEPGDIIVMPADQADAAERLIAIGWAEDADQEADPAAPQEVLAAGETRARVNVPARLVVIDDDALTFATGFEGERDELDFIPEGGLTLAEAYRRFVEADPLSRTLFVVLERLAPRWAAMWADQQPGYRLVPVPRAASGVAEFPRAFVIPACYERWPSPRLACWEAARAAQLVGDDPDEDEDCVPEIVVQTQERYQARTAALVKKFRDQELAVEGIREYPEPEVDLKHEKMACAWWSRNDLLVGFKANALFRIVTGEPVLWFSGVRVVPAEGAIEAAPEPVAPAASVERAAEVVPAPAPPPPKPKGRPTLKDDIAAAFYRLATDGALNDCETLRQVHGLVQAEVCKAKGNKDLSGLGFETVRRVISLKWNRFKADPKFDPKL